MLLKKIPLCFICLVLLKLYSNCFPYYMGKKIEVNRSISKREMDNKHPGFTLLLLEFNFCEVSIHYDECEI